MHLDMKAIGCNVQLKKVTHSLYFPYAPYDFFSNSTPMHVASVSCYEKHLC